MMLLSECFELWSKSGHTLSCNPRSVCASHIHTDAMLQGLRSQAWCLHSHAWRSPLCWHGRGRRHVGLHARQNRNCSRILAETRQAGLFNMHLKGASLQPIVTMADCLLGLPIVLSKCKLSCVALRYK